MINEKESLHARVTQLLESTHCPKHGMEWEACCFTEVVLELHNKTTDLLTTVRKEEREAADSERRDILNAIEHSQRLCTHRAQDNSKTGEYRLMMEHFAEAGRQIAEMITGKRYQDLARPINQTEP